MNTLVIVLIAAVCLIAAYTLYGRWIAKSWGIDPTAKTPAVRLNDGKDYVPTDGWTVFSHQFSSIAGAGPVTGAIQAAAFGWLPVLLWILLGGVFFGAVTDFGALYASVKNDGKSMGLLIEKYIGKLGRKLHAAVHAGMRQHHHAACAARQFQHGLHGLVGRVVQHAPAARAEQLAVQLFINPVCVSIFKQQADEVCFVGDAAAPGKRLCLFPAELRV